MTTLAKWNVDKEKPLDRLLATILKINGKERNATLSFGPTGMRFRGLDNSHLALLDVFIPKQSFLENAVEKTMVGIELSSLVRSLKMLKHGCVSLQLEDENEKELHVLLKNGIQADCLVPTSAVEVIPPLPQLELTGSEAILFGDTVGETLQRIQDRSLSITIPEGNDLIEFKTSKGRVFFQKEDSRVVSIKGPVRATYLMGSMLDFFSTMKPEQITFQFASDGSLRIGYGWEFDGFINLYISKPVEERPIRVEKHV